MFDIQEELKKLIIENRTFIGGEYLETNEQMEKYSFVLDKKLPSLFICGKDEVDLAVQKAKESYDGKVWKNLDIQQKKKILCKLADLIEKHKNELVLLDCIETGRSLKNFYFDSLPKAVEAIRWFSEAVDKYFDYAITPNNNTMTMIVKQPIGVVGIITPWNDPLVVNFWKITPALLMGNSVVVKPAEQASYSMIKIASLAKEAGIPDGVLNIILGDGQTGKLLSLHNDVRGIFFTGSSEVGKKIMQYAGMSNMKKVGLECGGKSPFIVTKNCKNLQKTATVLAKNIFYNQGQICSAASRLIIDKAIKDIFLKYLREEAKKFIPKNPLSFNSEVGYLISNTQKEQILNYLEEDTQHNIVFDDVDMAFSPRILDNVNADSKLAQEEIFGPVLVVIQYSTIEDAITIANNTKYGLVSAVFSDDINEANKIALELDCGMVHINTYDKETNQMPFGGTKESGIGRDKSIFVFDEYSELKTIITELQ